MCQTPGLAAPAMVWYHGSVGDWLPGLAGLDGHCLDGLAGCLSGLFVLCQGHLRRCCDRKTERVCYLLGQPLLKTVVFYRESSGVPELCWCVVLKKSQSAQAPRLTQYRRHSVIIFPTLQSGVVRI